MLVRITNKCRMGCSHCMVEASPEGQHMSMDTYEKVLAFIRRNNLLMILISGGEPLEHPEFFEMVKRAQSENLKIAVLSNGMFLSDPELKKKVLGLGVLVQVTNDPRFYPHKINPEEHPEVQIETHIRSVSPFGRAVKNDIDMNRQSPLCFNLRSLVRKFRDFREATFQLRLLGKMCTPSVNVNGTLSAGESPFCSIFGTVEDSNIVLTNRLAELKCSKCGLVNNLDDLHREAIGEL